MVQELVGLSRDYIDSSNKSHFETLNDEFLGNIKKIA